MGQGASRVDPEQAARSNRRRERLSSFFHSQPDGSSGGADDSRLTQRRNRESLMEPLSRFREDFTSLPRLPSQTSLRWSLDRSRSRFSTFSSSISRRISTRRRIVPHSDSSMNLEDASDERDETEAFRADDPYLLPRVNVPDIDFGIDDITGEPDTGGGRSVLRRHGLRPTSSLSDRLSSFRPDRGIRNMTSSLRRRRSPLSREEDQAAMLSRLLSVAAAATAATLMNGDQRAVNEARSISAGGEDGTFEGFLQSLQSGRIADALRQNGSENNNETDADGNPQAPLNFFRMFRFGTAALNTNSGTSVMSRSRPGSVADTTSGSSSSSSNNNNNSNSSTEDGVEGRMVPIIIVGIRSINPGAQEESNMPPFLDALSSLPNTLTSPSDVTIDGLLRQPQHGTRITHRRRASMGGLGTFPANYDSQRHHRTADRPRPLSTPSDNSPGPRPPPSTPASTGLSAFPSGSTTPTTSTGPGLNLSPDLASRRSSFVPRSTPSALDTPIEEPSGQEFRPRPPRRARRLSESDFSRFGSGSARRNGLVAPDAPTDSAGEGSRSWIIYVLGGNYPENHPILTTPSLFTESPTYEDMMLLSALLGPAKPPVASEADVASAPGLLTIFGERGSLLANAVSEDGSSEADAYSIALAPDERCLVCLCDFEAGDTARKLVKCGHLFHRTCIDQWLTTGRNSCPLCRGQGVDETTNEGSSTTDAERQTPSPPVTSAF